MGKMVNRSLGGRGNKFQINGTKLGWFGSKLPSRAGDGSTRRRHGQIIWHGR